VTLLSQSASVGEIALATPSPAQQRSRVELLLRAIGASGAALNVGAWVGVALLLAQQTYMVRLATGNPISWIDAFEGAIGGSLLWAAFTPLILRLARRFRVSSLGVVADAARPSPHRRDLLRARRGSERRPR
jgi:hypothetical protein